MERRNFLPSSQPVEGKSVQSLVVSGNTLDLDRIVNFLPLSKDGQEPSFEDVLKKAYGDFPKLKMHADLHPSEYKNSIDLIYELPAQLQDKWRLLRLWLWNQYGSPIFGVIFNLTLDKTRKETALLSDLPEELTNMVSELLQEDDDEDEEEIAGNITSESSSKRNNIRVNPEKRDFVILAEGGSKWITLTDKQRVVLEERYLADRPATLIDIAGRSGINFQAIFQYEEAGLRKLGFFGDAINLTRQQLQSIFKNAKEQDINSLTPKELEFLKHLYGGSIHSQHSYPTIKSVAADVKISYDIAFGRHQKAIQKLLHTKRAIHIDRFLLPTSEQVLLIRQKIPLQGAHKFAQETGISLHTVYRWQKQEGIQPRRGRPPTLPSPEKLEFIKTNYPEKNLVELTKLTGYSSRIITRSLRDAEIPIRKRGRKKINS